MSKSNHSIIISGFPGIGKTSFMNSCSTGTFVDEIAGVENGKPIQVYRFNSTVQRSLMYYRVHDSDSSKYSWLYDGEGNKTDQRNPDFPNNYIEHIRKLDEIPFNIILVSSHDVVRDALAAAELPFFVAFPDIKKKDEYLERYRERGSDDAFVKLLDENWDKWIGDLMTYTENHPFARGWVIDDYLANSIDAMLVENTKMCFRNNISLS